MATLDLSTPTGTDRPAAPPRSRGRRRPHTVGEWLLVALAIVLALVIAFPLIMLLLNAFKSPQDYSTSGPLDFPRSFYTDGVVNFWNDKNFPLALWNSFFIAGMVAVLAVTVSVLNAFAIGIGRVKGRTWLTLLFLMANLLPQEMLVYPLFTMYDKAHLLSNPWSVIITFTVIQGAFGTYLLASLYGTFPKEILEAAALDGASRWRTLRSVIVPISRPTLNVLMVFFFIWTWNEFLLPLSFLNRPSSLTVPLVLEQLSGERQTDVTTLISATLLSVIPTIVFFIIFQRTLTRGITAGAVK
ncbi:MAG: carbohydrate ABC transporter permease [Actinomycetales bacterium]|nr:carbohydrate ABC transporter permease [Actinomycetales bacterium]